MEVQEHRRRRPGVEPVRDGDELVAADPAAGDATAGRRSAAHPSARTGAGVRWSWSVPPWSSAARSSWSMWWWSTRTTVVVLRAATRSGASDPWARRTPRRSGRRQRGQPGATAGGFGASGQCAGWAGQSGRVPTTANIVNEMKSLPRRARSTRSSRIDVAAVSSTRPSSTSWPIIIAMREQAGRSGLGVRIPLGPHVGRGRVLDAHQSGVEGEVPEQPADRGAGSPEPPHRVHHRAEVVVVVDIGGEGSPVGVDE